MPKSNHRRISAEFQIDRLQQRHARLTAQVEQLEDRVHLTTPEELRLAQLKKEKLRTKDELQVLRTDS
jgi:hypothetical protein